MVVSTVALYFYVKNLLRSEIEEELYSTSARVETELINKNAPYSLIPIVEVQEVEYIGPEIRKDTIIYDPSQQEMEEFRELTSFREINSKKYRITVRNLVVETENILVAIILSYIIIILLVFIFLFYFNKKGNEKLWTPFFDNLEAMKKFSLSSDKPIALNDSEILEFSDLKDQVIILTDKVRSDYKNLKQYTEDVSHELQTPLAIIQAKIENIINGDELNNIQFGHLTSIQKDIQRLTQMNKRLTLLTKIENQQFVNVGNVSITKRIEEAILNFQEITTTKIDYSSEEEILVKMDPYLAEILCNNLISNAIKHNTIGGNLELRSKDNILAISNSGTKALAQPNKIYSRFYRESEAAKSTGLGLAIVKRICDLYNFKIDYIFEENKHIFRIKF